MAKGWIPAYAGMTINFSPVILAPAPQGRESNIKPPPLAAVKGAKAPPLSSSFPPSIVIPAQAGINSPQGGEY